MLLKANVDLYLDYGTMVMTDGTLLQLAQLVGYGYSSMVFYAFFKAGGDAVVHRPGERGFGRPCRRAALTQPPQR